MSSLASFCSASNSPVYAASKAAVRFLGEGMRDRLARSGIIVSVICPGFVRTPMNADIRPRLPLTMSAERAATIIEQGLARGRTRIAFPFATYAATLLLASLPPDWASRLIARPHDRA